MLRTFSRVGVVRVLALLGFTSTRISRCRIARSAIPPCPRICHEQPVASTVHLGALKVGGRIERASMVGWATSARP